MLEFKTFGSFNFTKLKANSFNIFQSEIFLNSVLKFTASPLQISTVNFCGEIIPENRRKTHKHTLRGKCSVFSLLRKAVKVGTTLLWRVNRTYVLVRQATELVNLFLLGLYATKGTSRYMGRGTPSHSNPRFIAVSSMRTLVGRPPTLPKPKAYIWKLWPTRNQPVDENKFSFLVVCINISLFPPLPISLTLWTV